MFATSARDLSRQWKSHLASYRHHRNDEHLEALAEEALRYAGMHLENDLSASDFWSKAPLSRRVGVLLFLVDRGVVERVMIKGRRVYKARENAEAWIAAQPELAPYIVPSLELISALRRELKRRSSSSMS